MFSSTTLIAIVALLSSTHVRADWAKIDDPVGGAVCGNGATILLPEFNNDAWDGVCSDLVADGCANAFIVGSGSTGSSTFARNTDLDCAATAPAGEETCTNAFRDGFSQCASSFSPGQKQSCAVGVYDASGQSLGVLNYAGSCLPSAGIP
ncbi:hypothetical protein M409DRAFT_26963 [Zasmidium cellare ATCC 36951]|uniref:Uncharacterized protein n=1 Tax=Zasmidium cellare ATCC 36951 TaxID=1080233 RepID=A0A6A6CB87_ZASCE|nr:uncharacterized protein M409DRAFT_26963 [Zasmidium cellare ATCC 36951]KAF2162726.1 hypothetical protein M409DRAFT_26963 [Zasmidium cellare ATCC 36951]